MDVMKGFLVFTLFCSGTRNLSNPWPSASSEVENNIIGIPAKRGTLSKLTFYTLMDIFIDSGDTLG